LGTGLGLNLFSLSSAWSTPFMFFTRFSVSKLNNSGVVVGTTTFFGSHFRKIKTL